MAHNRAHKAQTDAPMAKETCADCPIRHRAVCARCETDELALLEQMKSYKTYSPGTAIVWAEEPLVSLGSIVEGVASLSRTMEDGRRQLVGLLLPSDFIGRPHQESVAYDVVAVTEVRICEFRKPEFEALLAKSPAIGARLLDMTMSELDAAREWMLLLGRKTAREKVASLLIMLARRVCTGPIAVHPGGIIIELPLTREEVGDFLGLTLETTSRQMSALKRDGIIELQDMHRVHIPDLSALLAETGD